MVKKNLINFCSWFIILPFSLCNKEYDLTWMYTEGREMSVFTNEQFEFALMKMRGMVDYEFLIKLTRGQPQTPGTNAFKLFLPQRTAH